LSVRLNGWQTRCCDKSSYKSEDAMVDKLTTPRRNVVDFMSYQQQQERRSSARALVAAALSVSARTCRHCGAALTEGEFEDECSSAFNIAQYAPLRFRAIPER
jgi:hypothetical protein